MDGLTKISNHRTLIENMKEGISEAGRTGSPMSIAIFDIDDFKKVNDSKGHVYGDQVLADVAQIIKSNIRDTDLAGRYGGEEFMVLFSNADLETASNIAERIRSAVESNLFVDGITVTVSGGVKRHEGESVADLIHAADRNLYEAKKNGKNRIVS
jgi:diguanylate cyclase (GGDEF)-like protein